MNRVQRPAVFVALWLVTTGAAGAPDSVARLDEDLVRLALLDLFAGTVLVAQGDEILLHKGYGLADRENKVAFGPETISSIGSITKQFTAAAILKLEELGKLSVDEPLSAHFKNLPPDKADITLHQLLTHSAGLPEALGADEEWISRDDLLEAAWAVELESDPGTEYSYSNVGYSVLASLVEKVSGKGYEEFLQDAFFAPLGMRDTGYVIPRWDPARLAVGYRGDQRWGTVIEKQNLEKGFSWHLVGNGGIHSTPRDMHRWLRALRTQQVLSGDSTAKLFGRHIDEGGGDSFYGYGWVTFDLPNGETIVGHNGGNGYLFEDLNFFPHRGDLAFYLMVNDAMKDQAVSGYIVRILTRQAHERPPVLQTLSQEDLGRLAGSYRLPSGAELVVRTASPGIEIETPSWQVNAALWEDATSPAIELQAMSREVERVVQGFLAGDLQPLHKAYGESIPLERLEKVYSERLENWQKERGAVKGAVVLGTISDPRGFRTWVRIDFERSSLNQAWAWRDGSLAGWSPRDSRPQQIFYPESLEEFLAFSVTGGQSARVSFTTGQTSETSVRLGVGDNSLVARRAD